MSLNYNCKEGCKVTRESEMAIKKIQHGTNYLFEDDQ